MAIRRTGLKSLLKSLSLVLLMATIGFCFYFQVYFLVVIGSSRPHRHETQQLKAGTENAFDSKTMRRRNVIVVSHGRSGSSLVGDIFNRHPSVFYMYEPLQTAKRLTRKSSEYSSYGGLVEKLLTGIFRCIFDQQHFLDDIEDYYRNSNHPRVSQAIASPPLCPYNMTDPRWDPKLCHPMTKESLGNACKDNYDLTAIKVLMDRIPEYNIRILLSTCNSTDVDCKVVFLVRDPRAVIPSSRSFGFFREKGGSPNSLQGTRLYSYRQCKQTEDNLELIRKLPNSVRKRIRLLRFEDLALNPLKELVGLYEFAGLTLLESVRTWLNETTRLNVRDCTKIDGEQATCTKDNAQVAVNRWRWKVHPYDIGIIEYYCESVMRLLGYRPVDRSYELLADVTTPLFYDEYEAKTWFLR